MESQTPQAPATPPAANSISAADASRRRPSPRGRGRSKIILLILAGVALVFAAIVLYRGYAAWESTDDAQIDGYILPVSARVPGYVARVVVDNNQYVEAGTVLMQLDPTDYRSRQCQGNARE